MPKKRDIAGLRVAITGGTSGLGLSLVRLFRAKGAQVAFVARGAERVLRIADETGACGIVGDVGYDADIYPLTLQITGSMGGIDVLINNAASLGPASQGPLSDTVVKDFELALAVNLLGPFRLTRALYGALTKSAHDRGSALVVNVVTSAAVDAYPGWGAYGVSKMALQHMTAVWNKEARNEGIQFAAIDPGDMDTPFGRDLLPNTNPRDLKSTERIAAKVVNQVRSTLSSPPFAKKTEKA